MQSAQYIFICQIYEALIVTNDVDDLGTSYVYKFLVKIDWKRPKEGLRVIPSRTKSMCDREISDLVFKGQVKLAWLVFLSRFQIEIFSYVQNPCAKRATSQPLTKFCRQLSLISRGNWRWKCDKPSNISARCSECLKFGSQCY